MKRYLAVAAILLAVAPVRADNTTAGGGADLLSEFAGQFLGDLDNFAELTGQVLDMIEHREQTRSGCSMVNRSATREPRLEPKR